MRLKTLTVIALLGLTLIAVLSFAQAEPPSDRPGNILDTIAGLQTQITELLGNATEQQSAIQAEVDARLSGDQELSENATAQQNAIDAIVRISPEQCPEAQYVSGIDQDGKIICNSVCSSNVPNLCWGIGCVDLLNDNQHCGECSNSCSPSYQCINGECGCQPPLSECNDYCINLQTDVHNCGSCGNVCLGQGIECIGGLCQIPEEEPEEPKQEE